MKILLFFKIVVIYALIFNINTNCYNIKIILH